MRSDANAVIGNRPEGRCDLKRRDANLLTYRNRTHRRRLPALDGANESCCFARQFNARARAEAETLDVVVHALVAHTQTQLYSGHVARFRQLVNQSQSPVRVMVVTKTFCDYNRTHLAINSIRGFSKPLFKRCGISDY